MKKYLIGLFSLGIFFIGVNTIKSATTTCGKNSDPRAFYSVLEINIDDKVRAAKIDYNLNPDGFREELASQLIKQFGRENTDKIGYFVYTELPDGIEKIPETVETVEVSSINADSLKASDYIMTDVKLNNRFGNYFNEATKKNPQLVGLIKQTKGAFKPEDLFVSFPNKFIQLGNGRLIALFSGCTPRICSGSENLVAYDLQNKKVFLLEENMDSTKVYIYGSPDSELRDLLLWEYAYYQ